MDSFSKFRCTLLERIQIRFNGGQLLDLAVQFQTDDFGEFTRGCCVPLDLKMGTAPRIDTV